MVLSAILKLDAGAFTTPLGKAVEGMKAALRIAGDLSDRLTEAFDMGGQLSDMQAQTGELPGTLLVLKRAFQDTGVGADALGQTLGLMRKAMGGINDEGEPTAKIFQRLGLDIEKLKSLGAEEQFSAIGAAIRGLRSPAEQSAASMAIFGRSGQRMLTFLKDPEAINGATRSLGQLPDLMNRNAQAFDAVSDRIEHIKLKGQGLWAGIAEGLLPLADQLSAAMDGIDLTGLGQRIGEVLGTTVQIIKTAPLGDAVRDLLQIGFGEAVNYGVAAFARLGKALLDAMSGPLATLSAEFGLVVQGAMEGLGKLPGAMEKYPILKASPLLNVLGSLGEKDSLKGFQSQSFNELRNQALADIGNWTEGVPNLGGKFELIDVSAERKRISQVWDAAAMSYKEQIGSVQKQAQQSLSSSANGKLELSAVKTAKDTAKIDTDALTRIGGYTGGGMQTRLAALTERTARGVERMVSLLEGQRKQRPAWGV